VVALTINVTILPWNLSFIFAQDSSWYLVSRSIRLLTFCKIFPSLCWRSTFYKIVLPKLLNITCNKEVTLFSLTVNCTQYTSEIFPCEYKYYRGATFKSLTRIHL